MLKLIRHSITVFMLLLSLSSFAGNFTFSGTGNWTDASKWQGGHMPPAILHSSDTVNITGTAVIGADCVNGECPSGSLEMNGGRIIIASGGTLTLQNPRQFSNSGTIVVQGTLNINTLFQGFGNGS